MASIQALHAGTAATSTQYYKRHSCGRRKSGSCVRAALAAPSQAVNTPEWVGEDKLSQVRLCPGLEFPCTCLTVDYQPTSSGGEGVCTCVYARTLLSRPSSALHPLQVVNGIISNKVLFQGLKAAARFQIKSQARRRRMRTSECAAMRAAVSPHGGWEGLTSSPPGGAPLPAGSAQGHQVGRKGAGAGECRHQGRASRHRGQERCVPSVLHAGERIAGG